MTNCSTRSSRGWKSCAVPNRIPLDELNPALSELEGERLHWARKNLEQDFGRIDAADEDTLNRIIWHSVKGVDAPYPAEYAGAHEKGLAALGLRLAEGSDE